MAEMIRISNVNLENRLAAVSDWRVPESVRADLKLFIRELGMGKVNRGRRLKESAQVKYLFTLKVPLEFFNKAIDSLTITDIEEFEKVLNSDTLISAYNKRPFKHATKVSFRKALKIFLRWKLGGAKSEQLAGWVDTRPRDKTPDYLSEDEIKKLFSYCRSPEQRYVVAILFDSGARAQEFVNIRYEDIELPSKDQKFAKIHLRQEFSKTLGRNVSLYWNSSIDALTIYLKQRISEGIKPQDPVFNNTYPSIRMFLKRLGQRSLKRHVHPHLFRHSSATYYASRMNRQELCYRYGWRFSSDMPDVYISRAGLANKELDEKFKQNEISEIKNNYEKMEVDYKIKTDRLLAMEKKIDLIMDHFGVLSDLHSEGVKKEDVEKLLKPKIY